MPAAPWRQHSSGRDAISCQCNHGWAQEDHKGKPTPTPMSQHRLESPSTTWPQARTCDARQLLLKDSRSALGESEQRLQRAALKKVSAIVRLLERAITISTIATRGY
eukprot:TRINITY_DN27265_c0_g1_i1.p1 TRINITY_DN27265_c0_g1~~TRINITY_DN27265_c0_g1_i1.p1  ORF type:complete len:107 (-),score=3.92 TRINITY_DN27265_c0_g1_i1:149-469(-)